MARISIADLVQFEGAEKINKASLEEDTESAYAATRNEVFKLVEQGRKKKASKSDSCFYEIGLKTKLEQSISKILNAKSEDVSTVRARRSFKYEFDKKMARIKRIKSRAYRRVRRMAKAKQDSLQGCAEEVAGVVAEDRAPCVPDQLLKAMEPCEEEDDTPVLVFEGPEEPSRDVQEELVRLAFKEDAPENEREFVKEKQQIVNSEAPRMDETILPGWGSWAGPGLEVVKTKENTVVSFVDGVKHSNRKDFNKSHVVINENAPEIDRKFQAELPFGYTEEEYCSKIKTSVSREWNTLRIFKKLVKTKPSQVNGSAIEPLRYNPEEDE